MKVLDGASESLEVEDAFISWKDAFISRPASVNNGGLTWTFGGQRREARLLTRYSACLAIPDHVSKKKGIGD